MERCEKNNILSFYRFISDGKRLSKDKGDFATFDDAHYVVKITEAILESNKIKKWVKIK